MASNCSDCGVSFNVEPEELEWLRENEKELPNQCPRCRAFHGGIQDESITCTVCGKVFIYPRELRWYSKLFNWPRPRRCIGGCRANAPAMTPQEELLSDFLRRLRGSRKINSLATGGMHMSDGAGLKRRFASHSPNSRSSSSRPVEGADSLAKALKEFQDKKRRRGR